MNSQSKRGWPDRPHTERQALFHGYGVMLAVLLLIIPVAADAGADAVTSEQGTVKLWVYKKWIGASGTEATVEIYLDCPGRGDFARRLINRDRPDGWTIEQVPAEGFFCSVGEVRRETFVPDVSDCRNLLLLPGRNVECTMVNTKVVKRIDMLNRYGLGLMIVVMLAVGLTSVRKLGSF